jgi:hypothetical protein
LTGPPGKGSRKQQSSRLFVALSLNEYLQDFGCTPHLTDGYKDLFCSVNPEKFLFHNG